MLVAALALFAAGSGVGAAGSSFISGSQIKAGSITARQLAPGSVTRTKLAAGAIPKVAGPQGPRGDTGPAGPAGPQGPPGAIDLSKIVYVDGPDTPIQNTGGGINATVEADCPPGGTAIGGGFNAISPVSVVSEGAGFAAQTTHSAWRVRVHDYDTPSGLQNIFTAHAICAMP